MGKEQSQRVKSPTAEVWTVWSIPAHVFPCIYCCTHRQMFICSPGLGSKKCLCVCVCFQLWVQRLRGSVTEQTVVKHQRPAGNLLHTKHLLELKLQLLMEPYLSPSLSDSSASLHFSFLCLSSFLCLCLDQQWFFFSSLISLFLYIFPTLIFWDLQQH